MAKVTILSATAFLAMWFALWLYAASSNLSGHGGSWSYDPLFYPNLLITLGILLSCVLFALAFTGRITDAAHDQTGHRRVLAAAVIISAYMMLIVPLGFLLDSAAFIAIFGYAMGYRNPMRLGVTAVVASGIIFLIFTEALRAPLPALPWFMQG